MSTPNKMRNTLMSAEVAPVKKDCFSFTQHILTENNFVCVRYWLNELTGRKIEDFERFVIQSRLTSCADRLGFGSVNQFVEYLGQQTSDFSHPCWQALLDAALETESWFRREARHFSFLRQIVLPYLNRDCRILSAGCSAGEEAYDLAFECAVHFGLQARWQVDGIDVRKEAIELAELAHWDAEECSVLPENYLAQFFESRHHGFQVLKEIREKVRFRVANLLQAGNEQQYDVIFCRNVLVEMEKRCGQNLTDMMMQWLKPGGYLVTSHSEKLEDYLDADLLLSPHIARAPLL